jgi:Fe-S cluster biogenesis protein NfuA
MKIAATLAGNWLTCRYDVDEPLCSGGAVYFGSPEQAEGSPLPAALFKLTGVKAVKVSEKAVALTRDDDEDWVSMSRKVAEALGAHKASGQSALAKNLRSNVPSPEEIREIAQKLIDEKINPALDSHGGSIELVDVQGASVHLKMKGGCQGCSGARATLRHGVERSLREEIPQLDDVVDVTDHSAGSAPHQH